ncbi:MAG: hypothetical protein CMI55_00100 [Parcubacteria group bacterium]|jgi:hypothetical protein|nr:hypothetical protein [Parcubacteria group bacterium]|tara:strand:+ start:3195 stop:3614 length:420 start_codon:yes stop_codon:yes gene_type:complete
MEFFAVTTTSVYCVSDEREEKTGFPIVEKIAMKKGVESRISVGGRLKKGHFVGITQHGIGLYDEDHPRAGKRQTINNVNTLFWGGHTSAIVALFLNKKEAIVCLNSEVSPDLTWEDKTKETLKVIGYKHPVFDILSFEM